MVLYHLLTCIKGKNNIETERTNSALDHCMAISGMIPDKNG